MLRRLNSALSTILDGVATSANNTVTSNITVSKNNRTVTFGGYFVNNASINTNTKILTIPEQFRPIADVSLAVVSTGGNVGAVTVKANGEIHTASSIVGSYWMIVGALFN